MKALKKIISLLLWLFIFYIILNFLIIHFFPIRYEKEIDRVSEELNMDKSLILAVIKTESGFDKSAVSSKRAMGLTQVIPETVLYVSQKYNIEVGVNEIFEPYTNIRVGMLYLKNLIERFGSTERAILAYNAGPSVVKKWIDEGLEKFGDNYDWVPYKETRNYIKKIEKSRRGYEALLSIDYRAPEIFHDYYKKIIKFAKSIKSLDFISDKGENR